MAYTVSKSKHLNPRVITMNISVKPQEMIDVLSRLFVHHGFTYAKAQVLAQTHTESTMFGVYSHGVNRVPVFIDYVKNHIVKTAANAEQVCAMGAIERWDGQGGAGILNARTCTARAIELAKQQGIGLVALKNTNHWMRAGTYGWQVANAGCIGILFTNTQANMPPWGGKESRVGNNPLVIAIPKNNGHVVLDMALSQFSFGKMHEYQLKGEKLPCFGGWDEQDNLSDEPAKILSQARALPIGYWKGSAFSMVLDMLATLLSAGHSTSKISNKAFETNISQVFLCINPQNFGDGDIHNTLLNEIINYTRTVEPMNASGKIYYPGERAIEKYQYHQAHGMLVSKTIWQNILQLMH